jgi:hypothetical protein
MKLAHEGTLFIPDISGFTRFVKELDIETGKEIITQLLSAMINSNKLDFNVAEIEGDAILYYKYGKAYPIERILSQFVLMYKAFHKKLKEISSGYPAARKLSIKLIVHYGPISNFSVNGFYKLYGSTVIEAHRLLKNNLHLDSYILITDAYIKAASVPFIDSILEWEGKGQACEFYNDLGNICYTFFPCLGGEKKGLVPAKARLQVRHSA